MNGYGKSVAAALVGLLLPGCDVFPTETPVDDSRLDPLWRAAEAFDRESHGFSPLPTRGSVGWEKARGKGYDAMLHQGGETYRTIAFVRTADGFRWIGEQESFEGPGVFHTVDGEQRERLTLTYEIAPVSGVPLNGLHAIYRGEDPRLAWPRTLGLADVEPILAEWGYRSRPD